MIGATHVNKCLTYYTKTYMSSVLVTPPGLATHAPSWPRHPPPSRCGSIGPQHCPHQVSSTYIS
jgi:hypothetical protein